MLFSKNPKVRLEQALYERAAERARRLGLVSVEAYVAYLIERDLKAGDGQTKQDTVKEVKELKDQLKGLGYLQ